MREIILKWLLSWRRWKLGATSPQPKPPARPADPDHMYAAVIAAREEALAAVQAKSAFLSNMSHELRSPMNAMLGMAELLADTQLNEEQRHYLDVIVGNGKALLALVNDILDFARAESGNLKLEAAEFNLIELVEGVAETLAPEAHRKGLELSVQIGIDVPFVAIGDYRRLQQILMNLAGNAIKFTVTGEVAIVVTREPGAAGVIRVSVIDTGIGIEAAEHERIFASYAQAATRPAAPPGSGLGLAIVKQLTELMGGRVSLESAPGAGSSFHCAIRLGYRPRANHNDEYEWRRTLAGRKLLLDGGLEHARAALAATLASFGATVQQVHSAIELAAAINAEPQADALLIDMPAAGTDSAVTNAIDRMVEAARTASLPVIALIPVPDRTAWLRRLVDLGIRHYAIKPARRAELSTAIRAALAGVETDSRSGCELRTVETPSQRLPAMRILVADDAEDNRMLIQAYLRESGCQLDLAGSGAEAMAYYKQHRYDVVLMDLHMPGTDGYEAIRQMRAWEQARGLERTPIIALTAAVLEDAVRQSLDAGCDTHLSKPVKRSTLFSILREAAAPSRQAGLG